jgi:hypothetical protein
MLGNSTFATALILIVMAPGASAQDRTVKDADGFKPMFNLPKFWIYNGTGTGWGFYDDETIVCRGAGGGWLMHPKEFGDVELRLEYKMARGSNSGVTLRCPRRPPAGAKGSQAEPYRVAYEIQLVDDENSPDGKRATTCTGSIYGIVPAKKRNVNKPLGEWNHLRVVAKGTKVTVTLNGETIQDVDLKDYAGKVTGKNPHFLDTKGYVGVQSNAGKVEFRNLRIKDLSTD